MNAAELLFKVQSMKDVKGVTVQAVRWDAGTDSWMPKIQAPVDIYIEEYAWEVRAVHLDYNSGRERNIVATNTSLELALASIRVQIEFGITDELFS